MTARATLARLTRIARRLLRWTLVSLLLLVILLPFVVLATLASEGGSRWLLTRVAEVVEADVGSIQGTLLRGITLEDVRYQHPAATVMVGEFRLAVVMPALLQRRLTVSTLQVDRLHVTLHAQDEDDPEETSPAEPFHIDDLADISLPLDIVVHGARITDLTLVMNAGEGEPIVVDEILLAGSTDGGVLDIQELFVRQDQIQLSLAGSMGLTQPFALDTWFDWQAPLPEAAATFLIDPAQRDTMATDDAVGEDAAGEDAPLMARGDARIRGTLAEPVLRHRLQAPLTLLSEGRVRPFDEPLAFDLTNRWDAFTLYTAEGEPLSVGDGELAARGVLDDYALTLETGTTLPDLPAVDLALDARGSLSALQIREARLAVADSQIQVRGDLAWEPVLAWDIHLDIRDFNPGMFVAELPGQLSLQSHIRGSLADTALQLDLELGRLGGTLRNQRLAGGGSVSVAHDLSQPPGDARVRSDLRLQAGANHLSLRGTTGPQRLDLTLALAGGELRTLWPDLHGALNANVRVHGHRQDPVLEADIDSEQAGYGPWRVNALSLRAGATQTSADTPHMRLNLSTGNVTQSGEVLVSSIRVTGQGNAGEHTMNWAIAAPQGSTQGSVSGMLEDMRAWQGMLQALVIDSPISGQWALDRPVALGASAEAAHLDPLCLVARDSRLCMDGSWRAEGPIDARLDLTNLSLAYLAEQLPEDSVTLDGHLDLSARFQQRDGVNTGEADLQVSPGRIALSSGRDEPYELAWRGIGAHVNLDGTRLESMLDFDVDDTSGTRANLRADLDGDNTRLDGALNMHLDDLGWVEAFAPQLRNIQGRVRGDLNVTGTVANPRFGGQILLDEAGADVPDVGLSLTDIQLLASAQPGGNLTIDGRVHSGDGDLRLEGALDTSEPLPWPVQLRVYGENFLAAQLPDARVLINPDINIRIVANRVIIRGDITVPEARFEPRELPQQAVSVSRDEVIVSLEPEEESPWEIDTEVTVRLGDRVSIEGFGLQARFVGGVRIEDKPGRTPRLIGEIRIEDGRYRAYGQNLHVERGTLIFQGPPDNPGLDIVAVRIVTTYNVRAGLAIGGTLQAPRSRVFSEPAMDETEAMAFLLTGRPLEGSSETDATAIMQAIAIYGIERGEFITDRLGQTLGLEVGVDTEGEFEDTALMLGKQLSSRLYLRYSVGLFEALNTVMLRYSLSRSLSLETRTNARENAIDLIFRTER